jgi:hypothetical protein
MSDFKKIFVIFVVAIVLATVCNIFTNGANATEPNVANTENVIANTNVNSETENNAIVENNTNTENTENNAITNTNTNNTVNDVTQTQSTLPKTGSNYKLKKVFVSIISLATLALFAVFIYNKKVGMTDETKR